MSKKLFVNLSVADLQKSIQFFTQLGFTFNPQFTDENATCMIVGEDAFVMLLVRPFFQGFTQKAICDTSTHQEALISFSCESRAQVDELLAIAEQNGATVVGNGMDYGFMYQRTFMDLDGHHWEPFWMDPAGPPQA